METPYQLKTLTPAELQALSQDVKRVLRELYGERLERVILFGSYARGDFHEESDVDYLAVLTDEEVKPGKEIRFMIDWLDDLTERYNVLVSVKPASLNKYRQSDLSFYQNVRQKGRLV